MLQRGSRTVRLSAWRSPPGGCDTLLAIKGEVGVWPLPGEGREICSRDTQKPNDFRLTEKFP